MQTIFGENCIIHTENPGEPARKPCFWIRQVSAESQEYVQNSRKEERVFFIHYFPKELSVFQKECLETGDLLMDRLEFIHTGTGKVRCSKRAYAVGERTLDFSMHCSQIVRRTEEKQKMTGMEAPQILAKG